MQRSTASCRHCGRSYEGRGIYADHGLAQYNLARHEGVCTRTRAAREAVAARRQIREDQKYRRRIELSVKRHGGIAPTPGQLGFPFDGVPAIVA